MVRINKSQYAILGMLSRHEMSGYDIKQKFSRIAPFHWSECNAQIYPVLKQLEKEGMVSSKEDAESGKRRRRIYMLTHKGKAYLHEWLLLPPEMSHYREELLLKLSLAHNLTPRIICKHLEDYAQQIPQQQKLLAAMLAHIKDAHKDLPDQPYLMLTYRYSEMLLQTKLQWCHEALACLEKARDKEQEGK